MAGNGRVTRVTGAARRELTDDLLGRYAAGASVRELAASVERSYGFVHRILVDGGAVMRGRGGATRKRGDQGPAVD